MRIVVTGGCGFVGFNLARSLFQAGHSVTLVDNLVRRGSEINVPVLIQLGIPFVHGDIRNPEDVKQFPSDADCLIECSSQPSVVSGYDNPLYDFTTNVTGVVNCLDRCRRVRGGRGSVLPAWDVLFRWDRNLRRRRTPSSPTGRSANRCCTRTRW